jgi:Fe-S-cluster containining protein
MTTNRRTRRIAEAMKRVALPRASAQLRSLIATTHRRFDRDLALRIQADADRSTSSCQPGCAACCERAVLLTWAEADLIVAQHRNVVAEVLPELDRQNTVMARLGAERGAQTMAEGSAEAELRLRQDRWYGLRIPCALLEQSKNLCRVYESRPLACRSLLVASPPGACERRESDLSAPASVVAYEEGPEYHTARLAHMSATSEALGGTVVMGLLPSIIAKVFRESTRSRRDVRV